MALLGTRPGVAEAPVVRGERGGAEEGGGGLGDVLV